MILSLNSSAVSSYSFGSSNNAKTRKTSLDAKQVSSNEVLGYKVDKDGYFTEEFNEAARIPKDYKIHSSTMQSLVRVWTDDEKSDMVKSFSSIDIAKTIANAYKLLSQVVGEDILNSKDSFTLEEIAQFPQGYEYNRQSMQVSKIYNTTKEYVNGNLQFNYNNNTDTMIDNLFFSTTEDRMKGKAATNIFSNNNGGQEGGGVFINVNGAKYTNPDGSITKGGLLVAVMNENIYTIEGETTMWGKIQGFDKSISSQEANSFKLMLGFNGANTLGLVVDTQGYFSLMAETDIDSFKEKYAEFVKSNNEALEKLKKENKEWEEQFKNYKDPITQMLEKIRKSTQEELKRLEERKEKQKQEIKKLDIKA